MSIPKDKVVELLRRAAYRIAEDCGDVSVGVEEGDEDCLLWQALHDAAALLSSQGEREAVCTGAFGCPCPKHYQPTPPPAANEHTCFAVVGECAGCANYRLGIEEGRRLAASEQEDK